MSSEPFYPPYNQMNDQAMINNQLNQGNAAAAQTAQMQYQMEEVEKNLASEQLDCDKLINELYHNLKQDILKPNLEKGGILDWTQLADQTKRILTDEGVDKIMQIMKNYINKETLLSNFDENQIKRRMKEFRLAFSGLVFMKYENIFRTPTMNECRDILNERINQRIEKEKMRAELFHRDLDIKSIVDKVLNEAEKQFDYELDKIKSVKTSENLREFVMMFTHLSHLVESIHNRAWKGEERGSLRRHFNINEVIGGQSREQPRKKRWGIF